MKSNINKIVLIQLVLLLACSNAFILAKDHCNIIITEEEAIVIATDFFSKQAWSEQFIFPAESISHYKCEWVVEFKNVHWKEVKPSRGGISVNMENGLAKWLPRK